MKNKIPRLALFVIFASLSIFFFRYVFSGSKEIAQIYFDGQTELSPPVVVPHNGQSPPIMRPPNSAINVFSIQATNAVADPKAKKVYVRLNDEPQNFLTNNFAKVVIFSETTDENPLQTEWRSALIFRNGENNLSFDCRQCAALNDKKNYYARIYIADSPDDGNFNLRLENEKSGDFYLQSIPLLINSGKK